MMFVKFFLNHSNSKEGVKNKITLPPKPRWGVLLLIKINF